MQQIELSTAHQITCPNHNGGWLQGWPLIRRRWRDVKASCIGPLGRVPADARRAVDDVELLLGAKGSLIGPKFRTGQNWQNANFLIMRDLMVGERGFEPPTPWSRTTINDLLKLAEIE
jgi:hypothetical protein